MKQKLRYFGKDVELKAAPRIENTPEPMEVIEKRQTQRQTYTEQYFVFDTKDGRALRVCRNATDKTLRDDPPVEIRGHRGAKAPLEDPKGLAVALYVDGARESVFVTESRNPYAAETEQVTLSEAVLFNVALRCPELDAPNRKPRRGATLGHWHVFLAAWKERLSCYEMERRKGWNRRTAQARLNNIERTLLNGKKVANLAFDAATFDAVNRQLEAGRQHGRRLNHRALLDNTDGSLDEDRD